MPQAKIVKIVELSRPAQAHGEEIKALNFREPTGEDAWTCGMPVRFGAGGEIIISMPEAMSLASRLASVPLSTIKSLPWPDLMACVGVVGSFFGVDSETEAVAATSSNAPSTSPGLGEVTPIPSLRSA